MIELFAAKQPIDVNEIFSTLITYAIDDIKDFGAKNTAYSKTIILPGSKRNNIFFGNAFKITRSTQHSPALPNFGYNFNAAKEVDAIIFADNLQVFKGVLRLLQIIIDNKAIEYEVAVTGELGGFVSALANNKLTGNTNADGTANTAADLDFSAYDHTYSVANISGSWANAGAGSGYYYPLADYGTFGRNAAHSAAGKHSWIYKTFKPALFVKEYIEKILDKAGYTYDFPLLTTSRFKSQVVPHNTKALTKIGTRLARVDITPGNYDIALELLPFSALSGADFIINLTPGLEYTAAPSLTTDIIFHIEGTYNFDLTAGPPNMGFAIELRKFTAATSTHSGLGSVLVPIAAGAVSFVIDISAASIPLATNDYFYLSVVTVDAGGSNIDVTLGSIEVNSVVPVPITLGLGDTISINDTIPKNILQKDFFSSIVKLYNTYVYEDKNTPKKLLIKPFIDFYDPDPTTFEDWTAKVDRSQPIIIKPMSELTARYYAFKYASDSDFYNDLYKKRYNENYGDRLYDSGFEFAKDIQTVDIIFAGTPLVGYPGEDKVYPTIFKSSNGAEECIDSVIRILLAKQITGVTSWDMLDADGVTVLGAYTEYGYAGHFDDPDAPTNDLNFGALKELFFSLGSGALNVNQFNVYYSSYMAEITDPDSKLLSAFLRLTRKDINELDFSTFKYIDGSLFRLNKIVDYNATAEDVCKVELLKAINTVY